MNGPLKLPPQWMLKVERSRRNMRERIPAAFQSLYQPSRWKVRWGGRGSAKSWSFAQVAVDRAIDDPIKVLCVREFQSSIKDSVHALLCRTITENDFSGDFDISDRSIKSSNRSRATRKGQRAEFIFDGLHSNADQIKSKEGVDICWVEEAHSVIEESWGYLIPTIRDEGKYPWLPQSEIWVSFNQHDETDSTYKRLVARTPPHSDIRAVTWEDNPHFPKVLDDERRYMLEVDPDAYEWVWGTSCRKIGSAIVFKGHYEIHTFNDPPGIRPRLGVDWGFASDPTHLLRCYITEELDGAHIWFSHEAVGLGVELDDLPAMFLGTERARDRKLLVEGSDREWEGVPDVEQWPIKADSSRPETISYLRRKGLNVSPAAKWSGCVEDGVAHLKRYRKIHVHERCKHLAREARLYSYKVDARNGDVLPVIADKHNHGWDAGRYALDGEIQSAGGLGVWAKLAG